MNNSLATALSSRVVIADGGMGTMLQGYDLTVEGDFAMTVWWQSEPVSRPVRLLIESEDGVFDHWLQS